jgi:transposase
MFAGIDIASERHVLARLDSAGKPIGRPIAFTEDHAGSTRLAEAPGPPPVLVAMEATGHCWKNLFAVLTAAGHDVALLDPFTARRSRDASLERTKTDRIDAEGLARLALEKRPAPTQLRDGRHRCAIGPSGDGDAKGLRELLRHRDRLRQDFDDRVRQLHRLVDLGFPEFTRQVRSLDSMRATARIAEYPTAQAIARATPRRLAKLRYGGSHFVGPDPAERLVAAAKRSVGQHHGPVSALQARHICQDLDLWRRRLTEIDRDIEGLLGTHEVGRLLLSIDGLGPHSVARIIAAVGDPARFRSAGAFAAHVGVVPGLRQSGKPSGRTRAPIAPMGNARLRRALWMPVLGAVRRNPRLRAFHERLRAAGKSAKPAPIAAMRKLLNAVYSIAGNREPFVIAADMTQAAQVTHADADRAMSVLKQHLLGVTASHGTGSGMASGRSRARADPARSGDGPLRPSPRRASGFLAGADRRHGATAARRRRNCPVGRRWRRRRRPRAGRSFRHRRGRCA